MYFRQEGLSTWAEKLKITAAACADTDLQVKKMIWALSGTMSGLVSLCRGWFLHKLLFSRGPYIQLQATNSIYFWGITLVVHVPQSHNKFDLIFSNSKGSKGNQLYFSSREIAIISNSEPLPTTRNSVFFLGEKLGTLVTKKNLDFLFLFFYPFQV